LADIPEEGLLFNFSQEAKLYFSPMEKGHFDQKKNLLEKIFYFAPRLGFYSRI
jgi:hypothetical protein